MIDNDKPAVAENPIEAIDTLSRTPVKVEEEPEPSTEAIAD